MSEPRRVHDGLGAAAIVFFSVYALPWFVELPQLWYQPLARAWSYGAHPGGLSMDWFGRTANAVAASLVAYFAASVVSKRAAHPPSKIWSWAIAATLVMVMAIYAQKLAVRVPIPEPMPPGYTPR